MEGFLFGFQIWIMEVVPALGEICGTKVSKNFTGLVVIGEDVQNVLMKISLALKTYSQKTYAYIYFSNKNVYCLVHFSNDLIVFRGFCIHS